MALEENCCGDKGPDRCREGEVCWEGCEVGILGCVDDPLLRVGKAKLTKDGDPLLVAGLIEHRQNSSGWRASHGAGHCIEARAIDVDHFPTYLRVRDLAAIKAYWHAVCNVTCHGEDGRVRPQLLALWLVGLLGRPLKHSQLPALDGKVRWDLPLMEAPVGRKRAMSEECLREVRQVRDGV